ncbi:aldo/keto reductase [Solicola gregarius]|uniref:Aldo/keto reductase n=1 Tax=Solicola gregarius TaxID=2908642 RepID=A0AA46YMB9_9ACTN|nr:aldo/keto reductase [Solicola gregarius]UYM06479.1 aldo/keto reductase [Solicola gregarius]
MTDVASIEMNDGRTIPAIGFGTWPLKGDEGSTAVRTAIDSGYRMIDTAARYENEDAVGRAIAASDVPREQLFVTTKLRGDEHGYDSALRACEESLKRLGLDYVDLYLIHWPLPRVGAYVASWRAFVALRERGLVRSIGVSNFTGAHIDRLIAETDVVPAVNQIELHPLFPQAAQRSYDSGKGVVTQSWSPLGRGSDLLGSPVVAKIADAHEATPGQVVLAWHLAVGAVPIPKSADPERMRQNLAAVDLSLTTDDLEAIAELDRDGRIGGDPDTHEEF